MQITRNTGVSNAIQIRMWCATASQQLQQIQRTKQAIIIKCDASEIRSLVTSLTSKTFLRTPAPACVVSGMLKPKVNVRFQTSQAELHLETHVEVSVHMWKPEDGVAGRGPRFTWGPTSSNESLDGGGALCGATKCCFKKALSEAFNA